MVVSGVYLDVVLELKGMWKGQTDRGIDGWTDGPKNPLMDLCAHDKKEGTMVERNMEGDKKPKWSTFLFFF